MKKFLEELEKNPELKAKMEELSKDPASTPKDFIKAAAEYGVEIKEEDFQPVSAQGELQDDELGAVAGGYVFEPDLESGESCTCTYFGAGVSDEYHDDCTCIQSGVGAGEWGYAGCWCVFSGSGNDRRKDS